MLGMLFKGAPQRLALAACIMLAGCGESAHRAGLILINGAEPETLDPAIITGQPEGRIAQALFEGLTTFDRTGRPMPGMAESWTISPDGKTYTFRIRADARWSDGAPLTAHDFVKSWKRALTPETASSYNYLLFFIRNAQTFAEGKLADFGQVGAAAVDDRTLVVTLENATAFFLDLCAFPTLHPVPVGLIDRVGDDWVKPANIVSNGAYALESWRINDSIRLRKNPHYWNRGNVALETVDVLPIAKGNVAINFLASGDADVALDKGLAPPSLLDGIKRLPIFHAAPFLGVYFIRFNCARPPFDDVRARLAFSLAIDKRQITEKITRAGELPASSFVPPGIEGYFPPDGLAQDPAQARELLAAAGYPGGKGFPLTTYLYSEGELNEAIAVELQSMWRNVLGVNVTLARQEWKVYLNSMEQLEYGICRSSWVGDYPDPNTFLDMFVTGGGNNRTGWSDSQYDALIASANRETDPGKRFEILRRAESILVATAAPICPIYFYVGIQLYDPDKVGGIEANVLDEHPIKAMFRKDDHRTISR